MLTLEVKDNVKYAVAKPIGGDTNRILIVDLEATCWDDQETATLTLPFPTTIEVGMCWLEFWNGTWVPIVRTPARLFVKGSQTLISAYCTALTGITQERIDQEGEPIEVVWSKVKQLKAPMWASWGNWDRKQIELDTQRNNLKYPLPYFHVDVKPLWALARRHKTCGLEVALQEDGLPFVGTQHRGGDDAFNAAVILGKLLNEMTPQVDII